MFEAGSRGLSPKTRFQHGRNMGLWHVSIRDEAKASPAIRTAEEEMSTAPSPAPKITLEFCIWLQANFDMLVKEQKKSVPVPAGADPLLYI